MCYPSKEYQVGQDDVLVGKIGDIPFYISETQHEAWKNTDLIIDCIEGMGGMFSLDNGTGRRFLTRSEICIPEDTTINKNIKGLKNIVFDNQIKCKTPKIEII